MLKALAPYRGPSVRRYHSNEGGQKRAKFGQSSGDSGCSSCFWVGFPPAPRFQLPLPTSLLLLPLRTTLYHILAVSRLLSSRNLIVPIPLGHRFRESTKACGQLRSSRPQGIAFTAFGSFAIPSLRFLLIPARSADFLVEIASQNPPAPPTACHAGREKDIVMLSEVGRRAKRSFPRSRSIPTSPQIPFREPLPKT